jgi:hypothetical protein
MRNPANWLVLALALLAGCMWSAAPEVLPSASPKKAGGDRLAPIVRGTDDIGEVVQQVAPKPAAAPAKAPPAVRIDEKARTVRIPARLTRVKGAVEWLLSCGERHRAMSVLVTDCTVRDVASALAKVGLQAGERPQAVGEDRARAPKGAAVSVEVAVKDGSGKETQIPAARFLSARPDGEPLGEGTWVYVGPLVIREGEAEILVTDFSGSIVSTNLRDSSAMTYWVSKAASEEPATFVTAYYTSAFAPPAEGDSCELVIRPAK